MDDEKKGIALEKLSEIEYSRLATMKEQADDTLCTCTCPYGGAGAGSIIRDPHIPP